MAGCLAPSQRLLLLPRAMLPLASTRTLSGREEAHPKDLCHTHAKPCGIVRPCLDVVQERGLGLRPEAHHLQPQPPDQQRPPGQSLNTYLPTHVRLLGPMELHVGCGLIDRWMQWRVYKA